MVVDGSSNDKTAETAPKYVVILGGGLAGLSCGLELTRAGKKVVILEKNPYVGGLATTFKVGDFRFDTGPYRWFSKIEEVDKWVRQIMDEEFIKVKRLTRIYFSSLAEVECTAIIIWIIQSKAVFGQPEIS